MNLIYDRITLSNRQITDEGYLKAKGRAARTGIYEYSLDSIPSNQRPVNPIKNVFKVYRPPEEVFKPGSLESYKLMPITNDHPNEPVNSSNIKTYQIGTIADAWKEDYFVDTNLLFTDADGINQLNLGKKELSAGYICDFVWQPGITADGQQYDGIQKNIKINHLALVPAGRAGHECRVLDSSKQNSNNQKRKSKPMDTQKLTIDGLTIDVTPQGAEAIVKLQKRVHDAEEVAKKLEKDQKEEKEKKEKEHKEALDSLQAKFDAEKQAKDELEKKLSADSIDVMVQERQAILAKAKSVNDSYDPTGKSNNDIIKDTVKAFCKDVKDIDSQSEAYLKGRFDAIQVKQNTFDTALGKVLSKDGAEDKDTVKDARNDYITRLENKGQLPEKK